MVLLAFYLGMWVGGVAALWSYARITGRPLRWLPTLLWAGMLEAALLDAIERKERPTHQ